MEKAIYWDDLTEAFQFELIDAGFDNQNIIDGVFPVTIIYVPTEED